MAEDKEETHMPQKQETTICKHMTTKRFMRRVTETLEYQNNNNRHFYKRIPNNRKLG